MIMAIRYSSLSVWLGGRPSGTAAVALRDVDRTDPVHSGHDDEVVIGDAHRSHAVAPPGHADPAPLLLGIPYDRDQLVQPAGVEGTSR
jgi:hypothetical protein